MGDKMKTELECCPILVKGYRKGQQTHQVHPLEQGNVHQ